MTTVDKKQVDMESCPNCKQPVTVPKSTRSFICRSCDAIIKVISTDAGVELKVVGKSVEEDPTYQALENDIAAVKAELADLHARYLVEMARDYGSAGSVVRNLGVLAVLGGLVAMIFAPTPGALIAGGGLLAVVAGIAINASKKRAKQAVTGEISEALSKMGAQRDLLQRKAARMKTQV
jgi:hypothetical protein